MVFLHTDLREQKTEKRSDLQTHVSQTCLQMRSPQSSHSHLCRVQWPSWTPWLLKNQASRAHQQGQRQGGESEAGTTACISAIESEQPGNPDSTFIAWWWCPAPHERASGHDNLFWLTRNAVEVMCSD